MKKNANMKMHKRLYFEHNGERLRVESAWSWECSCGAGESHSTKAGAQGEWIHHKRRSAEPKEE